MDISVCQKGQYNPYHRENSGQFQDMIFHRKRIFNHMIIKQDPGKKNRQKQYVHQTDPHLDDPPSELKNIDKTDDPGKAYQQDNGQGSNYHFRIFLENGFVDPVTVKNHRLSIMQDQ
jgi:hypothetical protein